MKIASTLHNTGMIGRQMPNPKFKPLLAETPDNLENLPWPMLASPKFDGFRCCIIDGQGLSRNLKPIPNGYVFAKLEEMKLKNLDGELITYTNGKMDNFNTVQSKLTSRAGMPEFIFHVFDDFTVPTEPFTARQARLKRVHNTSRFRIVPQVPVKDLTQLMLCERIWVDEQGYEGVMLRKLDGIYKFGRSTVKEAILLKVKRFFDAEGIVTGTYELQHNANEAVTNALGYTERSSHQSNMVGRGVLGSLRVEWNGVEFDLGTGFDFAQREEYWKQDLIGKKVVFCYQKLGPNNKPTFPVFKGFRSEIDA